LSVAGFLLTTHSVDADRHAAAHRRAEVDALQVRGLLERARAFAVGLSNALQGEPVPKRGRFAALEGSATTTVGLTTAMWIERVPARGRLAYERRIGAPITRLPGKQVAGPAPSYLPATFITGVPLPAGVDMAGVPALAATLRDPAGIFAGTATTVATLAGRRGFYIVQGARFGRGPGSRGFLVVFVPQGWLTVGLSEDPKQVAIRLDGRPLDGALGTSPAATRSFEELTRRWQLAVAPDGATALQSTLPWLGLAWPPATALLVYLLGRGMLRRRRAERQVDDIFDLSLDVLCVAGFDGYLKRVNPAFERTLGRDAAELLSRPFLDFVYPADREATSKAMGWLGAGGQIVGFENRYIASNGAVRWLQWNTRPIPQRELVYAAARDVTDNRVLTQEQAALRRVATLVAEGHHADDVFEAVALEVGQLLGADATRLLRYEQDGTATVVAAYGVSDDEIGLGSRGGLDRGRVWGRIGGNGNGARGHPPSTGSDPVAASLRALGVGAAVPAPIVVSGRPWGVIVAAWKRADIARTDTEVRMAQFTELVATAIANAESRAQLAASRRRIVTTADQTRRRIERNLHDGTQQRLVSLALSLRSLEGEIPQAEAPLRARLSQIADGLTAAIDELRELSRGVHPAIVTSGGLTPAVKALARRSAVPVELHLRDVGRLPEPVEVGAYYVVAEALANATKYAQASEVQITVDADDAFVRLAIRDDGIGGADPSRGSGLIGLHDRVEALGGELEVRSVPGAGTTLTAEIPIPAPTTARGDQ
jgi:PAS domain S-box-containing protein